MSTPLPPREYAVRCPRCRAEALARMARHGTEGTYREVYVHFVAARISCTHCGYAQDVPLERGEDYELWYAIDFAGHRVWADNADDLERLIAWIAGDRRKPPHPSRSETYPHWLRTRKHRPELLRRLRRLRAHGPDA